MKLAHLSDLHLDGTDAQWERVRQVLEEAFRLTRPQHLLLGGDLADGPGTESMAPLVEYLQGRGFWSAERLTVVYGNHDIHPHGWHIPGEIFGPSAEERRIEFVETFDVTYDGTCLVRKDWPIPGVKVVGGLAIATYDSVSPDRGLWHAKGWFAPDDFKALAGILDRHQGPRILLMHHTLQEWYWLGDFDHREEAIAAVASMDLDAILCGHLHSEAGANLLDEADYTLPLGRGNAYTMGRSGGVEADSGKFFAAWHEIDVSRGKVRVKGRYLQV